jgi:Arc/MetJ family transcription regulator
LKTTRGLVEHALRELVRRKNQKRILRLRGKVDWDGDLDRMRSARGIS